MPGGTVVGIVVNPSAGHDIRRWFVNHGETVSEGQVIAEVQVEKVSQDVEAPAAGVLQHVVAEGVGVQQGQRIATIEVA